MTSSTSRASLTRGLVAGAGAGVIASLAMAMYAMFAALSKDTGFFTPLYHIASLLTDDADMMTSMMADQQGGDAFTFLVGPAILGAIIHMMTGAMYGAIFGALVGMVASRLRLGLAALAGIGAVYGFVVFVFSSYLALPVAAAIFDSGDPVENMAEMAGWGVFIGEHLLFGLVLGVVVALASKKQTAASLDSVAH